MRQVQGLLDPFHLPHATSRTLVTGRQVERGLRQTDYQYSGNR